MVDNRIPQFSGKGNLQQIQFSQRKQATTYGIRLDLTLFFLLLQIIVVGLQIFISFNQCVVTVNVGCLGYCLSSVFVDHVPYHSCDNIHFAQNAVAFAVNGRKVQQFLANISAVFQQCFAVNQQFAERCYEMLF